MFGIDAGIKASEQLLSSALDSHHYLDMDMENMIPNFVSIKSGTISTYIVVHIYSDYFASMPYGSAWTILMHTNNTNNRYCGITYCGTPEFPHTSKP